MQTPTVGRIVHYQAHGSPDGTHKPAARAAVITVINLDVLKDGQFVRDVGLCVLNPSGMFFNEHCLQDESATPTGGTWRWPPRT